MTPSVADTHPPVDRLRPGVIGPEERAHLRRCGRCRVEARMLERSRPLKLPGGAFGADASGSHVGGRSPDADLLPEGTRIQGYRLDGWLGAGGVAVVYRARHHATGERCAIKLLKGGSHEMRKRLIQEGRTQGSVGHPNVLGVRELVEHDGAPGLVMDFVEGPSLDRVLARRRLELRQVDAIARDVLAAVAAAHARGLVHRDLKPANILLDPADGRLATKVADFGLAKVLDGSAEVQTRSRVVFGTPAYMAPEQTEDARNVDPRTDVFSLGVILFELLTGERPFRGGSMAALLAAIQSGHRPNVSDKAPNAPPRIVDAIERALQVDPADRFADVDALIRAWDAPEAAGWTPDEVTALGKMAVARPLPLPDPDMARRNRGGLWGRLAEVAAGVALKIPKWLARVPTQEVQTTITRDGVQIAWAQSGETGPVVIFVLGWATHLEEGLGSPLYDRDQLIRTMSADFRYVRFDGRGAGMSERKVGPMSMDTRVMDLEAVVDATGAERVSLIGFSSGAPTSLMYTHRHPERVERLVLLSGMIRTRRAWDDAFANELRFMVPLLEAHWDDDNPAYRTWLASKVDPKASAIETQILAEFLKKSMKGRDATAFFRSGMDIDLSSEASQLTVPTLVVHNDADPFYPLQHGGRALAEAIPGAHLEVVHSDRHIVSAANDPAAFEHTWGAIRRFLGGEVVGAPVVLDTIDPA